MKKNKLIISTVLLTGVVSYAIIPVIAVALNNNYNSNANKLISSKENKNNTESLYKNGENSDKYVQEQINSLNQGAKFNFLTENSSVNKFNEDITFILKKNRSTNLNEEEKVANINDEISKYTFEFFSANKTNDQIINKDDIIQKSKSLLENDEEMQLSIKNYIGEEEVKPLNYKIENINIKSAIQSNLQSDKIRNATILRDAAFAFKIAAGVFFTLIIISPFFFWTAFLSVPLNIAGYVSLGIGIALEIVSNHLFESSKSSSSVANSAILFQTKVALVEIGKLGSFLKYVPVVVSILGIVLD